MTKGSMYVGRVGALAVALGVGMTVTSTQSSAWASPESPSAADSAPDNPGSDPTPKDAVDSTPLKNSGTEEEPPGTDPITDARKQITHSLRSVIHHFGPLNLPSRDSGGETRDEPDATNLSQRDSDPPKPRHLFTAPSNDNVRQSSISATKNISGQFNLPSTHQDLQSVVKHTISSLTKTVEAFGAQPAAVVTPHTSIVDTAAPTTQRQAAVPAPLPVQAPARGVTAFAALPTTIVRTLTSVANLVLSSLTAPRPGMPPDSPVMWAVLAVVRRQFFNQTPVIKPTVSQTDSAGNIKITVNQTDDDGDKLNYTATTSGDKGTVTKSAGGFTYVPNLGATGTDTVTITATEASTNTIHGLPGLINALSFGLLGDAGRSTTTTVTVRLNTPPEFSSATDPQTDVDGKVTGIVTFTDADGNPLTYTVPATSAKGGSVAIDSAGAYTYVPDQGQRYIAAGSAPGTPYTDTFTVTANDGHGGTTTKDVTVAIKPADIASNPQAAYDASQAAIETDTAALEAAQQAFSDTLAAYLAAHSPQGISALGVQALDASSNDRSQLDYQALLLAAIANTTRDDAIAKLALAAAAPSDTTLPPALIDSPSFAILKQHQAEIDARQADLQAALRTSVTAKAQIDAPAGSRTPYYERVEYTVNPDKSISGKVYFIDPNDDLRYIDDAGPADNFIGGDASGTFFVPAPAAGDTSPTVDIIVGAHDRDENFSGPVTVTLTRSTPTVVPADTPLDARFIETSKLMTGLGSAVSSGIAASAGYQAQADEARAREDEATAKQYEAKANSTNNDIANALKAQQQAITQYLSTIQSSGPIDPVDQI